MALKIYTAIFVTMAVAAQAEAPLGSLFVAAPKNANAPLSGLFIGRTAGRLYEDRPAVAPIYGKETSFDLHGPEVQLVRDLIEEAESRTDGYDAVQHGAYIKPGKRPTQMTLAEIFAWIDATPGQPHAIGRYQFIPETLRRVMIKAGIGPTQRFSPQVQDRLANILLVEAGFHHFRSGALDRRSFMNNLAKIWAGLPNSSGRSHYDGHAGNKASVSWARFDGVMAHISPDSG